MSATIEELKADAEAKFEAYQEARAAYEAAVCAKHDVQPGDTIAVEATRRGIYAPRKPVTKTYRVKRLTLSDYGGKVRVIAAEILNGGKESHVEREIWRDYRKVES